MGLSARLCNLFLSHVFCCIYHENRFALLALREDDMALERDVLLVKMRKVLQLLCVRCGFHFNACICCRFVFDLATKISTSFT